MAQIQTLTKQPRVFKITRKITVQATYIVSHFVESDSEAEAESNLNESELTMDWDCHQVKCRVGDYGRSDIAITDAFLLGVKDVTIDRPRDLYVVTLSIRRNGDEIKVVAKHRDARFIYNNSDRIGVFSDLGMGLAYPSHCEYTDEELTKIDALPRVTRHTAAKVIGQLVSDWYVQKAKEIGR